MTAFSIRNFSTILITQPYHILDSLISEQYLAKVPELVQDRAKIFEKGGEGTINISTYKHEKHENKSCSACPFVHQTVKSEAVVFNFDALSKRSNTLPVNFHTLKI